MIDDFTVEVDELDDVVGDLEACERHLALLVEDLDRQVSALHGTWTGLAADAQREAHAQWSGGMAAMRTSLGDLREAARLAHEEYTGAASANVAMWRGVAP
jgi:WXG100 family type VII secretion target